MEPSDAFRRRFVEAVRAGGAVGRLGSQRGQRHAEQQQGDGDVAVADAPSIRYEGHECRCGEGCGQKTGRQGRVAGDGHSRRREEQYPGHRVRPRGLPERTAFGYAADAAACLPYRKYSMKSQKSALKSRHPSAISASSGSTPFSTRAIAAAMRVMVGPSRVSISASGSTPLRRTTVRR